MAGIYIHIPFCKKACHYCDFHFSTSLKYKDEMLAALVKEISLQHNYLQSERIETIYFGGGTPSILAADDLSLLFDVVFNYFDISADAEITLEANPDDLTKEKIKQLKATPVNRFSIGVQSFFQEDLLWMNRAHSAQEIEIAIKEAQNAGFSNLTIDLIYGYPLLSDQKWQQNINQALQFNVPHLSAYSLTVEDKTFLANSIKKGIQKPINEEQSARQFQQLLRQTEGIYQHYEISNFAKPGCYAKHNSNYWNGVNYLGIGPSAHSFNGSSRQWNIANNALYIKQIQDNTIPAELETLSIENRVNEKIMTALRTMWGLKLADIPTHYQSHIIKQAAIYIDKNWLLNNNNILTLSNSGKLYADEIAAALFV